MLPFLEEMTESGGTTRDGEMESLSPWCLHIFEMWSKMRANASMCYYDSIKLISPTKQMNLGFGNVLDKDSKTPIRVIQNHYRSLFSSQQLISSRHTQTHKTTSLIKHEKLSPWVPNSQNGWSGPLASSRVKPMTLNKLCPIELHNHKTIYQRPSGETCFYQVCLPCFWDPTLEDSKGPLQQITFLHTLWNFQKPPILRFQFCQ